MRLVAPTTHGVGIAPANQIDFVPSARIREVVIEDRLVRRRGRQSHGHYERALGKAREHDRQGAVVAPPRIAIDRAQVPRLDEVAGAIGVRGAVTRERSAHLGDTLQAVAFLHNLQLDELRDSL